MNILFLYIPNYYKFIFEKESKKIKKHLEKYKLIEGKNPFLLKVKNRKEVNEILTELRNLKLKTNLIYFAYLIKNVKEVKKEFAKIKSYLVEKVLREGSFKLNEISYFDLEKEIRKEIEIEKKIKYVLEKESIVLSLSKIVDKEKKLKFYEVLARLIYNGKILKAKEFLPIAKKNNLTLHLDKVILKKCKMLYNKLKIPLFVNLFPISFKNLYLETKEDLIYELIEEKSSSDILCTLKEKNIVIAIDDFGTGYNNYKVFLDLAQKGKVKYIKIDENFTKGIYKDNIKQKVVKNLVELNHTLKIKVIAEFVEDEKDFNTLKALNVDYFQGYLFGKEKIVNI